MINKRIFLLLILYSISWSGYSQPAKLKKAQKIIKKATSEKLPGIAIYINDPNYGEWIRTEGYADAENKIELTKDHIFALGSECSFTGFFKIKSLLCGVNS